MSKRTVLVVDNSLYPTGAIRSILNMAEALQGEYTFQFVISVDSNLKVFLQERGFVVHRLPLLELRKKLSSLAYLPRLYRNAGMIKKIIQKEKVDILHINDLYNQIGSMYKIRGGKAPVVYHVRLLATSYIGAFYHFFAALIKKYADEIVAVSTAVKTDLGICEKVSVVYDALNPEEKSLPWDQLKDRQPVRILYLGNYVMGKGQNIGLEAFIRAHNRLPGAGLQLSFVGGCHSDADENFKKSLQARAEEAGVAPFVTFDGPAVDVESLMKKYDIVLNLSESESFSMVCLEAMIYGVPLIASDCGGPADITDNGSKALLVANKDADAAADAIIAVVHDKQKYKSLAGSSRHWASEHFSLQSSVAKLQALYDKLLRRKIP